MGSRIAAHFANAGIPALLLDIVIPDQPNRNAAALKGLESAAKQKPGGFFTDAAPALVKTGNFEDDLAKIADCDWIVEAVTEKLEIKRALWPKVLQHRKPDSIISTNTSGIPLSLISEGWPAEARRHFLGTHFFNPPRYLHLCEVIPGAETDPAILADVTEICDKKLGKGVVLCKDTPNFIANRIGSFYGGTVHKITVEDEYTVEEVDALTGPLIGLPNSASFRLLDIVGLDIWVYVGKNLYDAVPKDKWRDRFLPPSYQTEMMKRGWIGEKTGQGFFKRVGKEKEIHAIDWKTLEYHVANKVKWPITDQARQIEDLPSRLRMLAADTGRVGSFLWKLFSDTFLYCAEWQPEISERILDVDRAMRWGYAHTFGPFELWDALGFEETARRMEKEGRELPEPVTRMLSKGVKSFYEGDQMNGAPTLKYFQMSSGYYHITADAPGVVVLKNLKRVRGVVKTNAGASLIDLGDGVLGLEFHSKMNALGEDQFGMMFAGVEELKNFNAMVIANQGPDFTVGANLVMALMAAQEGEWDDLNLAIHRFQQANMAIKYAPKPVIVAPHARTLGGGCEIQLHGHRVQASAELYMGLVEVGVGLIPGGGGCKELIARLEDPKKAFELIGYAKVSSSANDAKALGLLDPSAGVSMNYERLIGDAKTLALAAAANYTPGSPRADIKVGGDAALALLKIGIWTARQGGYISDYDVEVGNKLAHVLAGGNLTGEQLVSEQYLLDLEREAFLSLCGNPKTQERMAYMLKNGKPLRN